jgi:predicted ATPase
VQRTDGQFVQGKCNQFHQKSQQNVIANAIGQYVTMIRKDTALIQHLRKSLGREMRCLVGMIPVLVKLFPATQELDDDADTKTNDRMQDMTTRKSQTRGAFLRFVAESCSSIQSLALFVDDIQWANMGDYEIIFDLLTTTTEDTRGLLLVGVCRVVDTGHGLARFF